MSDVFGPDERSRASDPPQFQAPPETPHDGDPLGDFDPTAAEPWVLVDDESFEPPPVPPLAGRPRGPRLTKNPKRPRATLTSQQRLLLLDTWRRSGLPAGDFAALVGVSRYTLYAWKKSFDEAGPAGLVERPRGRREGSRLPEVIRRTILMLKEDNLDWGCQRISDVLARASGLGASPGAVLRVLHEAGYELKQTATQPHRDHPRFFERNAANQLWQTDIFTFVLKRQNRRVHLVAFMDDHSRFIVGYGLHATASAVLVIEVFRAAVASYQAPAEVLTDNGTQYITWRGKSAFAKECDARGIKHIVAAPRHPQTLGKCERFWGTLWRECLQSAIFTDVEDARRRIGHFIDYYNFQRPHQGIEGLVPADRFFGAAPEVLKTLKARVAANALSLARNGIPKEPFYLTGQVGGQPFSVHAEGERVILTGQEGRKEVDLTPPPKPAPEMADPVCPQGGAAISGSEDGAEEPPPPGVSPLDDLEGALS